MARKRDVLERLKSQELRAAVDAYGLDVLDRRVHAFLVEALAHSRRATLADILRELPRVRLKEICRSLGLDDSGRLKTVLVDRLAPPRRPPAVAPVTLSKPSPHAGPRKVVAKAEPAPETVISYGRRDEPLQPPKAQGMNAIDLDRLLKLRLVVGRFGEKDIANWWNTESMLGRHGAIALRRGFRRTHLFVQARVVFTVAKSRCTKLWQPDQCMTLWHLPAEVEDQFEERWHHWLDEIDRWAPFFQEIVTLDGDLLDNLKRLELITDAVVEAVGNMRRSAEGRAVMLPGVYTVPSGGSNDGDSTADDVLTLLAAGFARGEIGKPAIPYARLEG